MKQRYVIAAKQNSHLRMILFCNLLRRKDFSYITRKIIIFVGWGWQNWNEVVSTLCFMSYFIGFSCSYTCKYVSLAQSWRAAAPDSTFSGKMLCMEDKRCSFCAQFCRIRLEPTPATYFSCIGWVPPKSIAHHFYMCERPPPARYAFAHSSKCSCITFRGTLNTFSWRHVHIFRFSVTWKTKQPGRKVSLEKITEISCLEK